MQTLFKLNNIRNINSSPSACIKAAKIRCRGILRSRKVLYDDGRVSVRGYVAKAAGLPTGHGGITVLEISDLHLREPMDKRPERLIYKLDAGSHSFADDIHRHSPELSPADVERIAGIKDGDSVKVALSKTHALVFRADGGKASAYRTYTPDRLDRVLGWRDSEGRNWIDRLLGREGKMEFANTNHFDRLIKKQLEEVISVLGNLPSILARHGRAPDVVLLLGDFIARNIKDITPGAQAALRNLCRDAPVRTAVFGNSDYTREFGMIVSRIENAGFLNLTNRYVEREIRGAHVTVLGVDDCNKGNPREPAFLDRETLPIVAVHNLDALSKNCLARASAIFSGHAHGGEFRFLFGLVNGFAYLKRKGKYRNVNSQTSEIKVLPTERLGVSCMSWGMGRYLFWRTGVAKGHVNVFTLVPE